MPAKDSVEERLPAKILRADYRIQMMPNRTMGVLDSTTDSEVLQRSFRECVVGECIRFMFA